MDDSNRYEWTATDSSAIEKIGYDKQDGQLLVKFKGSPLYAYPVSREVYEEFKKAPSKGKFFRQVIKDNYQFTRLDN